MIKINGKTYEGNRLEISANGDIIIEGKLLSNLHSNVVKPKRSFVNWLCSLFSK